MVAPGLRFRSYSRRAPCAEALRQAAVVGQRRSARGQVGRVAGVGVEARLAVGDDLRQAAEPRGDDGHARARTPRRRSAGTPRTSATGRRARGLRRGSRVPRRAGAGRSSSTPVSVAARARSVGLQLARPDDPEPCAAVGERPAPRLEQHIDAFLRSKPGQADEAAVVVRPGRAGVGRRVVLDDDLLGRPSRLQVAAAGELGGRDVGVDRVRPRADGAVEGVLDGDRERRERAMTGSSRGRPPGSGRGPGSPRTPSRRAGTSPPGRAGGSCGASARPARLRRARRAARPGSGAGTCCGMDDVGPEAGDRTPHRPGAVARPDHPRRGASAA